MINITQRTSYYNTSVIRNRNIEWIVIHYTAGTHSRPGAAANTASYFNNPNVGASADFIVDDATVVQYNPDIKNRYTWHSGGGRQSSYGGSVYQKCTNQNSIGIEVCSSSSTGGVPYANDPAWYFTEAVVANTVELTKYLMEQYDIDANHVVRHFDVTGKYCPGIVGWNSATGDESKWLNFKSQLVNAPVVEVNYKAKVTASVLNCRSGSSTAYPVLKTYSLGTVLTITKEQNGWGYVSNAGWVSLAYMEKIYEPPAPIIEEEEEEVTQEKFNEMMNNWMVEQAKLAPSDWSAGDRSWAEANGLIAGDEKGNKMYKKLMTREEFVAVLHRAFSKLVK